MPADSPERTCRATPARSAWSTTSASGCCPGPAARLAGLSLGNVTRRNSLPRNVGDAVVLRPAARSRTCSWRSAVPCTLRFSRRMLSRNRSVSRSNDWRRPSSKSRNRNRSGLLDFDVAQIQPLRGEIGDQRFRTRIGQHAPDLLFQNRRAASSLPAAAAFSSSSSGMLLHRKKDRREASSRSLTAMSRARSGARRIALDAIQELRTHQQPFERGLNSEIEIALLAALFVERQQRRHVLIGHRTAVRPAQPKSTESAWRRPASAGGVLADGR